MKCNFSGCSIYLLCWICVWICYLLHVRTSESTSVMRCGRSKAKCGTIFRPTIHQKHRCWLQLVELSVCLIGFWCHSLEMAMVLRQCVFLTTTLCKHGRHPKYIALLCNQFSQQVSKALPHPPTTEEEACCLLSPTAHIMWTRRITHRSWQWQRHETDSCVYRVGCGRLEPCGFALSKKWLPWPAQMLTVTW